MKRKTNWKRRIFLLLMAVLPQLVSLAGMGAMFYFVRIKEVFNAPSYFASAAAGSVMQFRLSDRDRKKIVVGSTVHAAIKKPNGEQRPEFAAQVTAIEKVDVEEETPWLISAQLAGEPPAGALPPEALAQEAELPIVAWSRTRRALEVIWPEGGLKNLGKQAAEGALGLKGGGG